MSKLSDLPFEPHSLYSISTQDALLYTIGILAIVFAMGLIAGGSRKFQKHRATLMRKVLLGIFLAPLALGSFLLGFGALDSTPIYPIIFFIFSFSSIFALGVLVRFQRPEQFNEVAR